MTNPIYDHTILGFPDLWPDHSNLTSHKPFIFMYSPEFPLATPILKFRLRNYFVGLAPGPLARNSSPRTALRDNPPVNGVASLHYPVTHLVFNPLLFLSLEVISG